MWTRDQHETQHAFLSDLEWTWAHWGFPHRPPHPAPKEVQAHCTALPLYKGRMSCSPQSQGRWWSQPGEPCALAHRSFISVSAITISTYLQHEEMDIKTRDTAVQFLSSLGLICCFTALPYQVLIDASFCSPQSLVRCISLHPHLCTAGEITALCKWIFNFGCHTFAALDSYTSML